MREKRVRCLEDNSVTGQHSGWHPLATAQLLGGDCVGICNMLMCEVKK